MIKLRGISGYRVTAWCSSLRRLGLGVARGEQAAIAFGHVEAAAVEGAERRAMADGDDRGLRQAPGQHPVQLGLELLVERGGRFVHEQPVRPLEQRAGDRE